MEKKGSISVVIPAYNAARTIAQTLESIAMQTYQPREVIVVDDGSTDNTRNVVMLAVQGFQKLGITLQYKHQPNAGVSAARNRGIALASCEYTAFVDSDDSWFPEKLQKQMSVMLRGDVDFVYVGMEVHNETTGQVRAVNAGPFKLECLRRENFIIPSTLLGRTECFRKLGGFDPQLQGVEDWDLMMRAGSAGMRFASIPEPLICYAEALGSLSLSDRMLAQELKLLAKGSLLSGLAGWARVCCKIEILSGIFYRAAMTTRMTCRARKAKAKTIVYLAASFGCRPSKRAAKALVVTALQFLGLYPPPKIDRRMDASSVG